MSIDARVCGIKLNQDGSGYLELIDRPPARPKDNPGCAGQQVLKFDTYPKWILDLLGQDIWGNDEQIMLSDFQIAKRDSYVRITFLEGIAFKLKG